MEGFDDASVDDAGAEAIGDDPYAGSSQAVFSYGEEEEATEGGPSGEGNVYIVLAILDDRTKRVRGKNYRQFLVRWKGYDASNDEWLYARAILDKQLIRTYEEGGAEAFAADLAAEARASQGDAVPTDDDGLDIDRVVGRRVRVAGTREVTEYLALIQSDTTGDAGVWVTTLPNRGPIDEYLRGRPDVDLSGRGWLLRVEAKSSQRVLYRPTGRREFKYLCQFEGELRIRQSMVFTFSKY
jgi:hypothetical protein